MAPCPGLPGWAGTRKVKPICILVKQETVSGSGVTTQFFTGRMPFLLPNQQCQSTAGKYGSSKCWIKTQLQQNTNYKITDVK